MEEKKCNCNEPWNSDYWCCPPKCPVHDKTIELPKQSEIGWVKASDRLPGYETPVKWRDSKDHSHATDGKIPLIHMAKPFLTGWEWYDESATSLTQSRADLIREANNRDLEGVAGREEDVEKSQFDNWHRWVSEQGYTYDGEFYYDEDLNYYTPDQLWGMFK